MDRSGEQVQELARAREEHRTYYGDFLSAAIATNPPRDRSQVWAQRDQKIAIGRATPEELGTWALEAKALADEENRRVTAARRKAWNDWVAGWQRPGPGPQARSMHGVRRRGRPLSSPPLTPKATGS